jgi:3-deoxy-D-manno-octulosonic-acid transferase
MTAFRDVAKAFLTNDAAQQVTNANEFGQFVEEMATDDAKRAAWGECARAVVAENRGASERTARRIVELLS